MANKQKKKLSIAHIHWGFPPIIGGVETHLTILLPSMKKKGHTVSLLTGAVEGVSSRYTFKGVNIYRTPVFDLNWLAKRGVNGLEREIRTVYTDFIETFKPDLFHAHNMHYFSKVHTRILEELSKKKGIPFFVTAHNVWDDNLFLDLSRKVKWTHIIAVSHFIKKELIGAGVDDRRITVIHHGIDEMMFHKDINTSDLLKKYPQLKGKKLIFHPARMGLAKGCDVSIKAMNIIRNQIPDAMLVLAGTKNIIDWVGTQQKDISYMVNLIEFFKLRKNVMIDCYQLDDMPALYAASSVCVYPSTACEPFGLTMLESLSSSKPMIVTEVGGMPEIIRDGIDGFVIPIKDFEVLASRIVQLLRDDQLRRRLGNSGREIVEQRYTKEVVTQNTINLYRHFV
ncbi:glycosyltransferase family 4 protein [Candidatus Omnitrophota bacterium]